MAKKDDKTQEEQRVSFIFGVANALENLVSTYLINVMKQFVKEHGKLEYTEIMAILIEMCGQLLQNVASSTGADMRMVVNNFIKGLDMWYDHNESKFNEKED